MSAKHKVRITNPTGDAVMTKVEIDGVEQYINHFDVGYKLGAYTNRDIAVTVTYPYCAVELELEQAAVTRRYSVRLFIPGYEGVSANGYGETIADALRDMASRLDAGQ